MQWISRLMRIFDVHVGRVKVIAVKEKQAEASLSPYTQAEQHLRMSKDLEAGLGGRQGLLVDRRTNNYCPFSGNHYNSGGPCLSFNQLLLLIVVIGAIFYLLIILDFPDESNNIAVAKPATKNAEPDVLHGLFG